MNVDIVRADMGLQAQYVNDAPRPLGLLGYLACFRGIVWREVLRFLHQRERFFSALVRPLVWLFIFAAGFRTVLGVSIIPPYETYVLYEVYVVPGLVGMILLFNAMQSSLSMVYDRETGAMRTLLVSPFPRSFLLLSKLIGGVTVAAIQAYVFLAIFFFWEADVPTYSIPYDASNGSISAIEFPGQLLLLVVPALYLALHIFNAATDKFSEAAMSRALWIATALELAVLVVATLHWQLSPPSMNYITVLPALLLAGLMLGSISLFLSSVIKQLENFAGVMNFVIFPMFFASSALYPLWRVRESSPLLYEICRLNPFTYAVELIRFALYGQIGPRLEDGSLDLTNLYVVLGYTVFFLGAAVYAYNPSKGLIARRGGPGGAG
ncbi:ABC transporter permease [Hyphomicrobium sp.]|uniref:ABC transporter permease n=1 Tax=Hyphomicrobium sp. TaxID=82 RepID=UPI002E37C07B|nr:ABC transporter permease [Hyphomicrobium sp.]HEX2841125.1 ABC transporter permease [Hyphomicrobium sp.]